MNKEKLYDVIKFPRISEKSTFIQEKNNQYSFEISQWANKSNVKSAISHIFGVKPKSVTVLNLKGKVKKRGNIVGKRSTTKKAYVTFESGVEINLNKIN